MSAGEREGVADAAVIAVPASVLGAITFEPPLAAREGGRTLRPGREAVRRAAGAGATEAVLSVPERFWCYTQLGRDGEPLPFVAAFAGTPGALESLDVASGPERWLAALRRLRPDLDLDFDSVLVSTWAEDPWVRGAYSARSATSPMDTEALARPVGPLFFAGEHTAGVWHGLMEGALRSGARAAQQLLQTPSAMRDPDPAHPRSNLA